MSLRIGAGSAFRDPLDRESLSASTVDLGACPTEAADPPWPYLIGGTHRPNIRANAERADCFSHIEDFGVEIVWDHEFFPSRARSDGREFVRFDSTRWISATALPITH